MNVSEGRVVRNRAHSVRVTGLRSDETTDTKTVDTIVKVCMESELYCSF